MFVLSLFLAAFIGSGLALDCVQIPASSITNGYTAVIPDGATAPVSIPPNYNCTYNIALPSMMYAHVRLENQLKGGNDFIDVRDAMGKRTLVSSRYPSLVNFYVFPGTTTTIQVTTKSVDNGSKFRMTVYYHSMPNPVTSQLGSDLKYFYLNDLQVNSLKPPQNVQSEKPIVLTTAISQFSGDSFDNYFIVDGTLSTHKGVYHLSDYTYRNFLSSGNNLTIVGLDNLVSMSSVIFSTLQNTQQFYDFTGVTTYSEIQTTQVNGDQKKEAVTVISKNTDSVILTKFDYDKTNPQCSVTAVSSPVTADSKVLLDFTKIVGFPYIINHKTFTIVVKTCTASFSMHSI